MRLLAFIPILVVALAVAACGGSSDEDEGPTFDSVLAQVEGLTGKAREDKLLELAEAEDEDVSFYTSMSSNVEEEVVGAFEDEYDLGVAVYRASSGTVLQRLLEEASAGFHGADVVESSGLEMLNLEREGVLVPYDSPLADGLVPGTRNEGWTTDRFNTFVVSWNTDLVEAGGRAALVGGPRRPEMEGPAGPRGGRRRLVQDALGVLGRGRGQIARGGRRAVRGDGPQRALRPRATR